MACYIKWDLKGNRYPWRSDGFADIDPNLNKEEPPN
jgi:hypothetical protein